MPYYSINNFKFGLDTRRSELTSQPGTLKVLNNAHINEGGEVEKRKAFVQIPVPSFAFGAQSNLEGILVFGSKVTSGFTSRDTAVDASHNVTLFLNQTPQDATYVPVVGDPVTVSGSSVTGVNGTFVITAVYASGTNLMTITYVAPLASNTIVTENVTIVPSFASPMIYQQLIHPTDGVYLTGVVSSTLFNDKAFVITQWSNGDVLEFYDGILVTDFISGLSSDLYPSAYSLTNALLDQVVATGLFTVTRPTLPTYLYFQITAGTVATGNQVTYVVYNFHRGMTLNDTVTGGTTSTAGTFGLLLPVQPWITDNATTAQNIVNAINTTSATTGVNDWAFTAVRGDTLTPPLADNIVVIKPPTTDAFGNALVVSPVDTLDIYVGGDVQVYDPAYVPTFSISSIASQSSANPFTVATSLTNAVMPFQLVSNGVPASAPANAAGQFTIINGSSNAAATGTITAVSLPLNNATVTVGSVVYTFVTSLLSTANEVLIGSTASDCLANLVAAINFTSGSGTLYSVNTAANSDVSASAVVAGVTTLTATKGGLSGNMLTLASSSGAFTIVAFSGGGSYASVFIKSNGTLPTAGDNVTVGGKTYRFMSSMSAAYDVKIAGTVDLCFTNLALAIKATGVAGTNYYTGTVANTNVTTKDQDITNHLLQIVALKSGVADNSITIASTVGTTFSYLKPDRVTTATGLTGGQIDANQISQIQVGSQNLLASYVSYNFSQVQTASDVVTAINAYTGTSGFSATASQGIVTVTSVNPGTTYNEALVKITCLGNVCVANANFIVSGAGNISAIAVNTSIELLTSTLTFQDTTLGFASETFGQFVQRVVDNVNANTPISGFLAFANTLLNQVFLSRATIDSSENNDAIVATSTLSLNAAPTQALKVINNTSSISFITLSDGVTRESINEPNSAVVTVQGGIPPYSYAWAYVGGGSSGKNGSNLIPQLNGQINQWWIEPRLVSGYNKGVATGYYFPTGTEQWICTVTDSAPTPSVVASQPFYLTY